MRCSHDEPATFIDEESIRLAPSACQERRFFTASKHEGTLEMNEGTL